MKTQTFLTRLFTAALSLTVFACDGEEAAGQHDIDPDVSVETMELLFEAADMSDPAERELADFSITAVADEDKPRPN